MSNPLCRRSRQETGLDTSHPAHAQWEFGFQPVASRGTGSSRPGRADNAKAALAVADAQTAEADEEVGDAAAVAARGGVIRRVWVAMPMINARGMPRAASRSRGISSGRVDRPCHTDACVCPAAAAAKPLYSAAAAGAIVGDDFHTELLAIRAEWRTSSSSRH
jgi:hypothetical protein